MKAREVNFDGLVGLTHHYAGLSFGNEASTKHRHRVSNPKLAAKQGLLKMKALADAGFPQAVIPPQERPNVLVLRQLGLAEVMSRWLRKPQRIHLTYFLLSALHHPCGWRTRRRSVLQPMRSTGGCI
jgi:succinylarginine dihydrolase